MLKRCLEKDPDNRWQTARDLKAELEWIASGADSQPVAVSQTSSRRPLPWIASAVLLITTGVLAFVHLRETPPEARLLTTTILPPDETSFNFSTGNNPPAISPDGRRIVFGARSNGKSELWVRPLDSPVAQPIAGTENATFPFWSPDNKSIAFFADSKLKRIDVAGGPALTIADAPNGRGGAWSPDDIIVFNPSNTTGLQRVAAAGGTASPATTLDAAKDRSHRFPWFLPDGRHFLFEDEVQQGSRDIVLRVASLDSKEVRTLAPANSNAVYAQGYLLFLRDQALMAQPFDTQRLATTGGAAPIGERVQTVLAGGSVGVFSVSRDGLLAYQTGAGATTQLLTWFDRSGKRVGTLGDAGEFASVEFSPDRKNVAVTEVGPSADLWIYEVTRGLKTRFTFDPAPENFPAWSPDGKKITFGSAQKGHYDIFRKSADLTGTEELLYADGADKSPTSWSPDGKFLLFTHYGSNTPSNIWVLPLTPAVAGAKPFPFVQTPFGANDGRFSPDGKWVAYSSTEFQRAEIYVAPFSGAPSGPGGKRQISTAGGRYPRWRADGKELFYAALDGTLMAAEVASKGGGMEVGAVRSLGIPTFIGRQFMYDVSADGQRFLVAAAPEQKSSAPLTLVYNWTTLLKK